jgi:hypothetical protein
VEGFSAAIGTTRRSAARRIGCSTHQEDSEMYIQVPVRRGLGESVGPFEGTFKGVLTGDENTSTDVTATFIHRDTAVNATIALGTGLRLDFGKPCAVEPVDLREIRVSGVWDPAKPQHIEATTTVSEPTTQFGYKAIDIRVTMVADLGADGRSMDARVTMKLLGVLPRACGSKTLAVKLTR